MITRFNAAYSQVKEFTNSSLITKEWSAWNNSIISELQGATDYNYIKVPTILNTMYGSPEIIMNQVAPLLDTVIANDPELADRCRAALYPTDSGGADNVMYGDIVTSPDLVSKMYQWLNFLKTNDIDTRFIDTVVEFGGGYGAQALVATRLSKGITYYYIDTPVVCSVAYQYLCDSSLMPVKIVTKKEDIVLNGINIVPHGCMSVIPTCEIFLSQGALCESPEYIITLVASTKFFGAANGMLLLWEHPFIMECLSKYKYTVGPFTPWKGQNFIFFTPKRKQMNRAK